MDPLLSGFDHQMEVSVLSLGYFHISQVMDDHDLGLKLIVSDLGIPQDFRSLQISG